MSNHPDDYATVVVKNRKYTINNYGYVRRSDQPTVTRLGWIDLDPYKSGTVPASRLSFDVASMLSGIENDPDVDVSGSEF